MTTQLYAEYGDPEQLVASVRALKSYGFVELEAYTPYFVEELAEALEQKPSSIPRWTFVIGLAVAALTYAIEWLLNAYLYPIDVGARPPHFPLAYVPISFEMGVLAAAFTAVVGVFACGGFGRLWRPVFDLPGFEGATLDRHWLRLTLHEGEDAHAAEDALSSLGATKVIARQESACT